MSFPFFIRFRRRISALRHHNPLPVDSLCILCYDSIGNLAYILVIAY